jgi:DNA-binding transcriptional ArsR family regulator
MPDSQHSLELPELPEPLRVEASDDELRVALPEAPPATFLWISVPWLTERTVGDLVNRAKRSKRRIFVSYRRSSAEARDALRATEISFAGSDGRIFVRAPGILVERDGRPRPRPVELWEPGAEENSLRNPFAKRSSRVPRWMLLHHDEPFSVSEIARAVELAPSAVSRVMRSLEDAAFVGEAKSPAGGRRRNVRLERPRALLDAWLPLWERRRVRRRRWDIGARDVDEALSLLSEAVGDRPISWAIGGLAGAAMVRRAVEPVDVLVWIKPDELESLGNLLQPEPARAGRGIVQLAVAPDPWTLGLARSRNGIPIADPVQLWLDCASAGERALEAAEAVADVAGWS